jgi:hypothetical protein
MTNEPYVIDLSRVPAGSAAIVGWHGEAAGWAALVAPEDWIYWQQWSTISAHSMLAKTPAEAFEKALAFRLVPDHD